MGNRGKTKDKYDEAGSQNEYQKKKECTWGDDFRKLLSQVGSDQNGGLS